MNNPHVSNEIREETLKFLIDNHRSVVATVHDNKPTAATVYYIIDEEFNIFFVTMLNSEKYLNISLNNKVAMVVSSDSWHTSVQLSGTAEFIFEEEKAKVFKLMDEMQKKKGDNLWPIKVLSKFKDSTTVVFKIIPDKLTFMNLDSERYPASLSKEYHEVIS